MALVPTKLYRGTPTTSSATLYTAPGNMIVKSITVTNTTGSAATLFLAIGGVNIISATFPATSTQVIESAALEVMAASETIVGLQSTASALNVRIMGVAF